MFTVLFWQSCSFNTKDSFLNDLAAFVSDVENNYTSYTIEDWEFKDEEFKQYVENKIDEYRETFTDEDMDEIGRLIGRYSVVRAKGYGIQLKEGMDDAKNYIEGFIEKLTDDTNEENNQ